MATEVKNNGMIELKPNNWKKQKNNKVSFQAESPMDKIKETMKNACARDGGKYIDFGLNVNGILVGGCMYALLASDAKTPHFVLLDRDRNLTFVPATEKYSLLKEIPINLSILNYLWEHERIGVVERTNNLLSDVEMVTPVYVRAPKNTNKSYMVTRKFNRNSKSFKQNKK